jgi:hypothetical protein
MGTARCLSDVACGLTAICGCVRRSWIPARRESVSEANRAFSFLIREGGGHRERRIARTRSLPALCPAAAGPGFFRGIKWLRSLSSSAFHPERQDIWLAQSAPSYCGRQSGSIDDCPVR